MLNAVRTFLSIQKYFSEEVLVSLDKSNKSGDSTNQLSLLTEREIEIVKLVADGLTNKQIGEKRLISNQTLDTHRTNLTKK